MSPDLNQDTTVYRWEVTSSSEKHGTFELGLAVAGLDTMLALPVSRKIFTKYFLDGNEISGYQVVELNRLYTLRVKVSAGVSRIYVGNRPGGFDFNPPLNREFLVSGGEMFCTLVMRKEFVEAERVFFDYSSVYSARETVEFIIGQN